MLLVVIMIGGAAPLGTLAEIDWLTILANAEDYFGTCGENITWQLDPDSGSLMITGIGDMKDYDCVTYWGGEVSPWPHDLVRHVTICNGISSIGSYAFYGCCHLSDVSLPDSLTRIGDYAFTASSLSHINIPWSVKSIGHNALLSYSTIDDTPYLQFITVDSTNHYFYAKAGVLFSRDGTELIQYPVASSQSTYSIPQGVTSIGSCAFCRCTKLTSVAIPNSVTNIGDCAFQNCRNLLNLTIPSSVNKIGDFSFFNCTSLSNITIPDSVKNIGSAICQGSEYYNDTLNWSNDVLYSGHHLLEAKTSISGSYSIRNGTICIADGAFECCRKLTAITIPSSVTYMGVHAFDECSGLIRVTMGGALNIGAAAFSGCSNLQKMTIPN